MIWLFALLFALTTVALIAIGRYVIERQASEFRAFSAVLMADRDLARQEVKVFRALLFPALGKIEAPAAPTAASSTDAPPHVKPPIAGASKASTASSPMAPAPFLQNRRMKWKVRWKKAAAATNTQEQRVNALADALAKQPKVKVTDSIRLAAQSVGVELFEPSAEQEHKENSHG